MDQETTNVKRKLNADIRQFIYSRSQQQNVQASSHFNPEIVAERPLPIVHHNYGIGNSYVVNNIQPAVQAPVQARSADEDEDKKPISVGQVLLTGGIVTGTAIAISYIWNSSEDLNEMRRLRQACVNALEELKDVRDNGPQNVLNSQILVLMNTSALLEVYIGYQSTSYKSKMISVGCFGATATGSVLVPGFLTSLLGMFSLGAGCVAVAILADNYFNFTMREKDRYRRLEGKILEDLGNIDTILTEIYNSKLGYPEMHPQAAYMQPEPQ
jgi:hypothetical protein